MTEETNGPPVIWKCPFCECIFFTLSDQYAHVKAFGTARDRHIINWHDAKIQRRYSEYKYEFV
jgi:hypothetical protein